MAKVMYKATVVYPTGDPYDADKGYGPSVNVRLKMTESADAPNTDDTGEFNLYQKAGTAGANEIGALVKGDNITLVYTPGGGNNKGYYSIVGAPETTAKTNIQAPVSQPTQPPWEAFSHGEAAAWVAIAEQQVTLFQNALALVSGTLPDLVTDVSSDQILNVALNVWRAANARHRRGMMLPIDKTNVNNIYLNMVQDYANSMDIVDAVVSALVEMSDGLDTGDDTRQLLKDIGLSSKDISDNPDTWLYMHNVISAYEQEIARGVSYDKAVSKVADEYGIEQF